MNARVFFPTATSWHSCLEEDSETADLRNGAEKELQDEMALP